MVNKYLADENISTPLCEIMGRNKSDKGHQDITKSHHNYTIVYHNIFKNIRACPIRIFELGLGTNNINIMSNMGPDGRPGASLYGWVEYFNNPQTQVFGADIDKNILFNTDNIHTFYCDQTNPQIINDMWNNTLLEENFDIIIEDGLHTYDANVCFFENSIHKLKNNGYYIIEDIAYYDKSKFINKIQEWKTKYNNCTFDLVVIPSNINTHDNTLLIIHKSD